MTAAWLYVKVAPGWAWIGRLGDRLTPVPRGATQLTNDRFGASQYNTAPASSAAPPARS